MAALARPDPRPANCTFALLAHFLPETPHDACPTARHPPGSVYGGTFALLAHFLPDKCGINTTFVDITDLAAVQVGAVAPCCPQLHPSIWCGENCQAYSRLPL